MIREIFGFDIPGKPITWTRPRITTVGGHPHGFNTKSLKEWKERVTRVARCHFTEPLTGPLGISLGFLYAAPKALCRVRKPYTGGIKTSRPDLDNLIKGTLDGLEGIAFNDDAQITYLGATKAYLPQGKPPKTVVTIWEEIK